MIPRFLEDFRLEVYLGQHEFSARYHLTASDAQTLKISELLKMCTDEERMAFMELPLMYHPTWGSEELRCEIASTYQNCTSHDVLVCAGAEEALFWAMIESVGPGDHAIVTYPNYQSSEAVPYACGVDLTGVPLEVEGSWALDLDRIADAIRPNTRLVAVNFPSNPTGFIPNEADFSQLIALCDGYGIRLLCDEIYRGLELDRSKRLTQAADLSDNAVSVNAMSKSYGLPGLRIGWVTTRDHAFLERLEKSKHYTSICNAAPSEALATIALRNGEAIQDRNRGIIRENLPVFDQFFQRWEDRFEWYHPDGGCVCFPRYLGEEGAEALCNQAIEQEGVVLLPPSIYHSLLGPTPMDRFRIGVGRRGVENALEAFDRVIQRQN